MQYIHCYVSILDDTYWGLIDMTLAFYAANSKYFEMGDEKNYLVTADNLTTVCQQQSLGQIRLNG